MKITQLVLPALAILISACAQKPQSVVVAPVLEYKKNSAPFTTKEMQFSVSDMRSASHIVQILREDEPAELYSGSSHLPQVIETSLVKAFKDHGINNMALSTNTIEVIIEEAKVSVDQTMVKYQASNVITLTVVVKNGQETLSQTLKTKGKSDGPLQADMGVLERDFNRQLGELLVQIARNQEIADFLK